eukprot:7317377-Prymnesium_polylepis.1
MRRPVPPNHAAPCGTQPCGALWHPTMRPKFGSIAAGRTSGSAFTRHARTSRTSDALRIKDAKTMSTFWPTPHARSYAAHAGH